MDDHKRELAGYFNSPVAYVFLVIFLLMTGAFTFLLTQFIENKQATLRMFFYWHPWLYLFLVPAVGMRLWSEERRLGTMELLLTMPISLWHCIVGKFLASWIFLTLALALTFPIWITVAYLGDPDHNMIFKLYRQLFPRRGLPLHHQHDVCVHPEPGDQLHSLGGDLPVPGAVRLPPRDG